jgi:hypothetical protein
MKPISNPNHTQYVIIHFHPTSCSPIGLTKVVKKPAERPKNWKIVIPLARCAKGKSSTKNAVIILC